MISDKCPFCKTKVEDGQHIYRCSHPVQTDQWNEELQKLALWLQNQSTEPEIRQMLVTMLQRWHKNPKPNHYCHPDKFLNKLAEDQHEIGWYALLQGFLANSIVKAQHQHFQYIGLLQSSRVWATALCRQLWSLFESMWDTCNSYYHEHCDTGEHELREALADSIAELFHHTEKALPPQYAPFFHTPLSKLLESGIVDQKNWFSLITTAHERQGSASSTIFSTNGTPRQWAGLPPIRPLCPALLCFADDQLWITAHPSTP